MGSVSSGAGSRADRVDAPPWGAAARAHAAPSSAQACCSVCSAWKVWRQGHACWFRQRPGPPSRSDWTRAHSQDSDNRAARPVDQGNVAHGTEIPDWYFPKQPQARSTAGPWTPAERGALTARQSWGPSLRADLRKATEPRACHGPPGWPGRPTPSPRSPSPGISRGSCRGPWALGSNSSPNTCFKNKGPTQGAG